MKHSIRVYRRGGGRWGWALSLKHKNKVFRIEEKCELNSVCGWQGGGDGEGGGVCQRVERDKEEVEGEAFSSSEDEAGSPHTGAKAWPLHRGLSFFE